jgi:hypothetical protein
MCRLSACISAFLFDLRFTLEAPIEWTDGEVFQQPVEEKTGLNTWFEPGDLLQFICRFSVGDRRS